MEHKYVSIKHKNGGWWKDTNHPEGGYKTEIGTFKCINKGCGLIVEAPYNTSPEIGECDDS